MPDEDVQVRREFRVPEGRSAEDMAGETDGEVLAVLDLRVGQEQLEMGLAREVVNRVQKLRKHAGLVATDVVQVGCLTSSSNLCSSSRMCLPLASLGRPKLHSGVDLRNWLR